MKIKLKWKYAEGEMDTKTMKLICIKARGKRMCGPDEIDAELAIKDGMNFTIADIHLGDVESSNALCEEIVRRFNEFPDFIVPTEEGYKYCIYDTDTPMMVKIKEFMALYGIVEITMRMLKVPELKKIMGFPDDYVLVGTQAEQKKYIGNAVEVTIARRWCEALCAKLKEHFKNAA